MRQKIQFHPRNKIVYYSVFLVLLTFFSCQKASKDQPDKDQSDKPLTTSQIIENAIVYSGKEKVENHKIKYVFRDKIYLSEGICGRFKFTRIDTIRNVKDVYDKNELHRTVNDRKVSLVDTTATKIKSAINSVNYFVQLPYRLKDEAVMARRLKDDSINGKTYYQLEVKFKEVGGGEDHQDVYRYWFDQKDFSMDYLAYQFYTNDGGLRFRVKEKEKRKNGIVFQNYDNFKPKSQKVTLKTLSHAFQNNNLEKVSDIITKPLKVSPITQNCD
ncbi:MAG: DUF6503 family protein [Psychroflexus sp.]|nr:DUF6503 family protein [Psychroflexus sp.]